MYHGDADEDDVGEVGEHDGQEHKVAELLAEARPLKKGRMWLTCKVDKSGHEMN